MASFRLGAIITEIQGSIGGTTIRRTPRNPVMYNKQGRQFRSANSVNSRASALGNIFRSWGNLEQDRRDFWNGIAPLYPQKDKFGNDILLSGRQFYTKLNAQLLPVFSSVDVSTFSDVLSAPVVSVITLDKTTNDMSLTTVTLILNSYVLVRVFPIRSGSSGDISNSSKFIYGALVNETNVVDFTAQFNSTYPYAKVGDKFGVNVIFMNEWGFRSSVQSFVQIVTE